MGVQGKAKMMEARWGVGHGLVMGAVSVPGVPKTPNVGASSCLAWLGPGSGSVFGHALLPVLLSVAHSKLLCGQACARPTPPLSLCLSPLGMRETSPGYSTYIIVLYVISGLILVSIVGAVWVALALKKDDTATARWMGRWGQMECCWHCPAFCAARLCVAPYCVLR